MDTVTPLLDAPKRRNVAALATALEEIVKGSEISVVYRTERYGLFRVTGPACTSVAYPGPVLAGHPLAPTGKPGTDVVDIDANPDPFDDFSAPTYAEVSSLSHGDLVTAHFSTGAWGDFAVTGHAVSLGTDALMLGGWLLRTGRTPGACMRSVTRLDPAATTAQSPELATIEVGS